MKSPSQLMSSSYTSPVRLDTTISGQVTDVESVSGIVSYPSELDAPVALQSNGSCSPIVARIGYHDVRLALRIYEMLSALPLAVAEESTQSSESSITYHEATVSSAFTPSSIIICSPA